LNYYYQVLPLFVIVYCNRGFHYLKKDCLEIASFILLKRLNWERDLFSAMLLPFFMF